MRRGGSLQDSDHRLLAVWAAGCAMHVLHLFEEARPEDDRPRRAIELARAWVRGEIIMTQACSAAFAERCRQAGVPARSSRVCTSRRFAQNGSRPPGGPDRDHSAILPPLPRPEALSRSGKRLWLWVRARICVWAPALGRALARSDLHGDERAADDQLCQGDGDRRPASRSVWTYCFMVTAISAMPQVTQPGVREHVVSAAAILAG